MERLVVTTHTFGCQCIKPVWESVTSSVTVVQGLELLIICHQAMLQWLEAPGLVL